MLGEFLTRLAIALPLVCALAVLCLVAVKRGWIRLPAAAWPARRAIAPQHAATLELLAVKSLSPATRLAVVRFDGRTHLVGFASQAITLIATAEPAPANGESL